MTNKKKRQVRIPVRFSDHVTGNLSQKRNIMDDEVDDSEATDTHGEESDMEKENEKGDGTGMKDSTQKGQKVGNVQPEVELGMNSKDGAMGTGETVLGGKIEDNRKESATNHKEVSHSYANMVKRDFSELEKQLIYIAPSIRASTVLHCGKV